jgi:tRNA modification GTPase
MRTENDTIAAIATPFGLGGIGVIRVSGALVPQISFAVSQKKLKVRQATFADFFNQNKELIDQGVAIYFSKPHSFTGEDVLELQAHGSPVVLNQLLQTVISYGARLAEPGEFSKRAFLNGKLDLAQAEAIMDLVNAASDLAAKSALRSLRGDFSGLINNLSASLIKIRMELEGVIDFPEEIDHNLLAGIESQIIAVITKIEAIENTVKQGIILRDGIHVVISGAPNVGKSTLMNALSGEELAIVTEYPGTTRDVLRSFINLDGIPLHLTDTAGIRVAHDSIEKEGIRRAKKEIENADLVILLLDAKEKKEIATIAKDFFSKLPKNLLVVYNKIDLLNQRAKEEKQDGIIVVYLSAKTKEGIDLLKEQIKKKLGIFDFAEGICTARARHLEALQKTKNNLLQAKKSCGVKEWELIAEDLRVAQNHLGEITGKFLPEDLLDRLFSEFCLGK